VVVEFIEATINDIDNVVLLAILDMHNTECDAEVGTVRNHVGDQEAIAAGCAIDTMYRHSSQLWVVGRGRAQSP